MSENGIFLVAFCQNFLFAAISEKVENFQLYASASERK
jgi:hypothetical protein